LILENFQDNSTQRKPGTSKGGFLANVVRKPEVVLFGLLIVVLGTLIWESDGFYRWDEGAHFVFDASALQSPTVSLGVWQRFGGVWLFTLPAQLGHKAVKVFASALFLLAVVLTYKVAELEEIPGKHWVIVLLGFQPAFLDIGYTCMAELPAALILVLSYYLYKKSEWKWSLFTASLVFLFRYEMYFFALIMVVLAWRKKQFRALPWIVAGPAIWYCFSVFWTNDLLWLPREMLRYGRLAKYEEGASLFHYVIKAPEIFGWAPVVLFVAAVVYGVVRKRLDSPILLLTVFLNLLISTLASSEIFHWTGAVGDIRYLVPIIPFFALVSLRGLFVVTDRIKLSRGLAMIPIGFAAWLIVQTVSYGEPHTFSEYEKAVISLTQRAAVDSIDTPILTNHWAAQYAMLSGMADTRKILKISNELFDSAPRVYVLWDPQLAVSPFATHTLKLADMRENRSIQLVDSAAVLDKTIFLFLKAER